VHVLKKAGKRPVYLPLRVLSPRGDLTLALLKIEPSRNGRPFYVSHPQFDVAAFELQAPSELAENSLLPLPVEERMLGGDAREPRAGEDVSFLGYPEGLSATPDMFPVLRDGTIASYDPLSWNPRSFLINGDVCPGDSGAPVVRARNGGAPRVIGMVIQRAEAESGTPVPVARAVSASVIRETLRLLAARERNAAPVELRTK
jgi:hypothetical protein